MFWRSSSGTVNSEIGREAASRRWRIARRIFLLLALIVGVIFLMGVWEESYTRFQQWRVESFADNLKKLQDEDYRRAMADTYGGKTPQETLRLYIEAVEKGDYELASKYFIESKRMDALARTKVMVEKRKESGWYIELLKVATSEGSLGENDRYFTMSATTTLGAPVVVEFFRYPNDIWKISSF